MVDEKSDGLIDITNPELQVRREIIRGTTSTWNMVFEGGAVVEVKHAALRSRPKKGGGTAFYPELVIRSSGKWYPVAFNDFNETEFSPKLIAVVRVDDD